MYKLLLTDQSTTHLRQLASELAEHYDVHTCSYGPDILEEFLTFQPELLILDTTVPGCDAATVLGIISSRDLETKVIATACGIHSSTASIAGSAACLMIKPYEDRLLKQRLLQLEQLLEQSRNARQISRIHAVLQELGIERSRVGFRCLTEAVLYLCSNPDCLFTDDLYPYTAKLCGGSAQSVDKAMQRCIFKAWRNRTPVIWNHYIGASTQCPTNVRFIRELSKAIQ